MTISDDSGAMLLLCSHLGLPAGSEPAPFTLREWNPLAEAIAKSPLKSPGALFGADRDSLRGDLNVSEAVADRIVALLDRRGGLAIETERLSDLGIWTLTRADAAYPARLKARLGKASPAVLFGAGESATVDWPGVAIVGSRDIDEPGRAFAESLGTACASARLAVFSGGARGTDAIAMLAALEGGGRAVGVLADSLEKTIRQPDVRTALADGRLTLLTPFSPKAGFSVAAAMGRNKLIYSLAEYAVVVASDAETGGTWAGASEALRSGWVTVFVREAPAIPEGNRRLLRAGGRPMPDPLPALPADLEGWLSDNAAAPETGSLFS